jgi:DNA-binding CsgD family transcriptional regulator
MRQLGFRSNRKAWIDTCSIEEALATDSIKLLLTPKEEETMNSKLANEVLRLTQQGQSSEEIAQEIGQSKMQVAGIKASISRGTYGDTKKKALAKAKQRGQVLAMLGKNKTDEQIIAKVGISKGTLGSYKAHVTMANS